MVKFCHQFPLHLFFQGEKTDPTSVNYQKSLKNQIYFGHNLKTVKDI